MNYKLYDNIKKKIINVDITDQIKNRVLKGELRILNEKESKLSSIKYKEYKAKVQSVLSGDNNRLPLYDINNSTFYYVDCYNVFYMIKEQSFRPLNIDLENFFKKHECIGVNEVESKKMLEIMRNYDYEILEQYLLKFIYYKTKDVGSEVTYLRNPAYTKFLNIRPYLKKSSIINTALNIGLISTKDLPINDVKLETIYKKISSVFFTSEEITSHIKHIDQHNMTPLINFYTMYGSFFLNSYLRLPNKLSHDDYLEKIIYKMIKAINSSPPLSSDKVVFRFVYDDKFLDHIMVGDTYTDVSFMSTTRKPSSSAENEEFGQILLKIHIPKNLKGSCLSIESDSVFRREKEVLLAPGSKLKLISINNDVDFYVFGRHINRNIRKKYEFKYIGHEEYQIQKHERLGVPEINMLSDGIMGQDLESKIEYFWDVYGKHTRSFYLVLPDGNRKLFYCNHYDSSDFYSKFFYYKITNGFYIFSFDDSDKVDCFFEIGDSLIANFPTRFLKMSVNDNLKLYASLICYAFKIGKIKVFPRYLSINDITKQSIKLKDSLFKNRITLNGVLYDLCMGNKSDMKIINKSGIEEFLDSIVKPFKVHYNIQKYIEGKKMPYSKFIKKILEKGPEDIMYFNLSLPSDMKNIYYDLDPYSFLLFKKLIYNPPIEFMTYADTPDVNVYTEGFRSRNFRTVTVFG